MRSRTSHRRLWLCLTLTLVGALATRSQPLHAQSFGGLPEHEPLNPTTASRSALIQMPYRESGPGKWRTSVQFDYGNAIEYDVNPTTGATYLEDAELMRTSVNVSRDLGSRDFVMVQAGVQSAYDGFTDGFFYWYHALIGFYQPERLARPKNVFGYEFGLPTGTVVRDRMAFALTDTRLTYGVRWTPNLQTTVMATLPTSTGPIGYGRGVPGLATVETFRGHIIKRVLLEATVGAGYTPRHGDLALYQKTVFASASTGVRIGLWGGQSIYGYFFYQTPSYRNTGFPSMDRREFSGDFGWMMRGKNGKEWRFGLAEDLAPGDGAIDLVLKVGRTF